LSVQSFSHLFDHQKAIKTIKSHRKAGNYFAFGLKGQNCINSDQRIERRVRVPMPQGWEEAGRDGQAAASPDEL